MQNWECTFKVNNMRTVQIVAANMSGDAKKIITAQYPGAKITWIKVTLVKK